MNKEEEEEDAVKEEDDVRSECKSARIVMASCNYTLAQLRIFPVFTCLCLRSIATRPKKSSHFGYGRTDGYGLVGLRYLVLGFYSPRV